MQQQLAGLGLISIAILVLSACAGPRGDAGPAGRDGDPGEPGESSTIEILTAQAWNADLNQPVVDGEELWLEDCLTAPYVAGANETALITATMGIDFEGSLQGTFRASWFANGDDPSLGQPYFCRECAFQNITVMDAVQLQSGVSYEFAPTAHLQGSGPIITRIGCQTLVQIVRTP